MKFGRREEAQKEMLTAKRMIDASADKEKDPASMDDNRVRNPELADAPAAIRRSGCSSSSLPSKASNSTGGGMPGAARLLDALRDRQDELFFVRASNHLHSNRQTFRRDSDRNGDSGTSDKVQPLRMTHRVAIAMGRIRAIRSFAVTKCR